MIKFSNTSAFTSRSGGKLIDSYKNVLKRVRKIATGRTANSLRTTVVFKDGFLKLQVKVNKSLRFIERGRRKGAKLPVYKDGDTFKLVPLLEEWKKAVGYTGSDYMLAKGISERGIKPTPVTSEVIKETLPELRSITQDLFRDSVITSAFADTKKIFDGVNKNV